MFHCVHCDEQAPFPLYLPEDHERRTPFCCQGCLTVYEILKEKSLTSYYDIKRSADVIRRRSPVELSHSSFTYLDDRGFEAEHSYRSLSGDRMMDFYLEGIHCLACLWLIEKLPEIIPGVIGAKLDLEKSVVTVTLSSEGKFSAVARELDRLGYRPHALHNTSDARELQRKEEHTYLKRLGVAGAAAGNIMIYSVSLYGGASDSVARFFSALTVILAVPVFTYSAWPFYQSAWTSLRNRTLSIDIPIALSLILGFAMGVRGLTQGFEENYFDSLTTLVFLLLLSRYFLKKIQDRSLGATDLHYFYQTESVLRKTPEGFEEIHTGALRVGDLVKIPRDGFIPADGVVVEGESLINNSLLTGESLPDRVKAGHPVFSGTQNLTDDLLIRVDKVDRDSRLGHILRNVEQGWALRSRTVDLTAVVSKYFTLAVILLSVVLFVSLLPQAGAAHALSRAITLLIVTCPCALAISVPLTFHRSLSLAAGHGIVVKSDEVFEKLAKDKKIYLDKTGTITQGRLQVTELLSERELSDVIFSLEKFSHHPVGRALAEFALKNGASSLEVSGFREIPGHGVEGIINGHRYEISGGEIFEDDVSVAHFDVRDGIRSDSREIIARLEAQGREVSILSGDKEGAVMSLARAAGVNPERALFRMSPERKVEIVKAGASVMVGDGANDAMALSGADVGIAVSGAMDIALRASDVYLTIPGLGGVEKLLTLSRETMKVVKRNLALSLAYNAVSVGFVFAGLISPLVAAIVMPVSSLTVLFSTLVGTKKMRSLWKS